MSRLARAFHRAAVPLAVYYAVTLALPVANGAARSGMVFVKHALVVLLVPLLAVALGGAAVALLAMLKRPSLAPGGCYTGRCDCGVSPLGGDLASTGVRDRGTRAEAHAPR